MAGLHTETAIAVTAIPALLVKFISDHKAEFGVEPICAVLSEHGAKIAPSTYYDAAARRPPRQAGRHDQAGRSSGAAGGPGAAPVPARRFEPAVGRRLRAPRGALE